jgi:hypothetical protein
MDFTQRKLQQGVEAGIITQAQADLLQRLWQADSLAEQLPQPPQEERSAPMSKFLYYLGALIVIGAMSWLMNTAWEQFKGFGLFFIAAGYAAVFCYLARYFREKSTVLSGLFVVMAVCMTPLGIFGLQAGLNLWPYAEPGSYHSFYRYIRGGWFTMEIATIAVGVLSLRYSRIPFAMAPIAFTLWFVSMDIAPILTGPDYNWNLRKQISLVFGLIMLMSAAWVERRQQVDYAKWLYIFGAITFWGGLSLMRSDSELSKFGYCLINVVMMFCGVLLNRKVFLVFGGMGFFGYLGYLSWNVFKNSIAFPLWLTVLGLAGVYLGWVYHNKYEKIRRFVRDKTPQFILDRLPPERRD